MTYKKDFKNKVRKKNRGGWKIYNKNFLPRHLVLDVLDLRRLQHSKLLFVGSTEPLHLLGY